MTQPDPTQPDPTQPDLGQQQDRVDPYDGLVLLSFGGPEQASDVMPFLRNVTAGRGIPDERLEAVAQHYYLLGGRSPVNEHGRELVSALVDELGRRELNLPVYFGNRNWDPFLVDALREAHDAGARRLVVVTTSAYSSYSSCRQYREDIAGAIAALGDEGRTLQVDRVRGYYNHPGFARTVTRLVTEALRELPVEGTRIVFVTHSIPDAMDETSGPGDGEGRLYQREHLDLAVAVTEEVNATLSTSYAFDLTYCSRSGPPHQPWLEPDINDHLEVLAGQGVERVVCVPFGFVSDHMEVIYDLDHEAQETATRLGVELVRVPTVGVDPEFVSGLVDLVEERAAQARDTLPTRPAWPGSPLWSVCPAGCCPNLRAARPAACGSD
ncbi:ferrochelatase [Arsenicicoccus piscis]|uniref:Coproporphyrin III ferrochelatase n=1 Tax=Arsenicicoccus piscis TaxID=673954 RepID=A0ABQ6HLZ9_9MICO|nr:ferrochelatase [Arsenicicoccus piscis]MCH8628894.1 ferrochelatase [Arsenicicoccus piscis]GMA19496.1 putative ferrochelatase [Arsenicicoccus piscis]